MLLAYYDRSNGATTTDYQETAIDLAPDGSFVAQWTVGPSCRSAIVGELLIPIPRSLRRDGTLAARLGLLRPRCLVPRPASD
jgi:hypothetical protein